MRKRKPKITDVKISEEDKAELNRILNYNYVRGTKRKAIAKLGYRGCIRCGQFPSKKVSYDMSDSEQKASTIEYYCSSCFQNAKI
jgi:hypothetical protein